jgi:S1-C subfamily serine protease
MFVGALGILGDFDPVRRSIVVECQREIHVVHIGNRTYSALLTVGNKTQSLAQEDRRVPSSPADIRLSYAPIVQRVQPTVVNIYAAKTVQNRNPLLDDSIFRRFFRVPGQQPEQMQQLPGGDRG